MLPYSFSASSFFITIVNTSKTKKHRFLLVSRTMSGTWQALNTHLQNASMVCWILPVIVLNALHGINQLVLPISYVDGWGWCCFAPVCRCWYWDIEKLRDSPKSYSWYEVELAIETMQLGPRVQNLKPCILKPLMGLFSFKKISLGGGKSSFRIYSNLKYIIIRLKYTIRL